MNNLSALEFPPGSDVAAFLPLNPNLAAFLPIEASEVFMSGTQKKS